MDYQKYKAECVKDFVAALLSTGSSVTETVIEVVGYKKVVRQAFKIADYVVEKLKKEEENDCT